MSRVPSSFTRGPARTFAASPAVAGFRPAGAALAIAAAFGLLPSAGVAQPAGAQAIHGQASFSANGNNLLVTTRDGAGTGHSAINWQSFSVPGGSTTWFHQPSAASSSINRVLGANPSAIFGSLGSNGKLVLVNPSGITVGRGAVIDTAGFTASTLGMSDADALSGRLRFAGNGGPLQVEGRVVARSGDVVLIAPQVQTGGEAVIESNGATVLAAGQRVEITGRGLEGIRLEVQAPGDEAVNLGTLKGDAIGIFAGTLHHSGLVLAQAVTTEGGKVVLRATGDNLVSGGVVAGGAGGKGGSIDVLGQRVALLAGSGLQASGASGGGQVRVGGDYQGRNADVPNALRTYVDAQAKIAADASGNGDGGRVIVWADEATQFHGQVSARGGPGGGNGGFAEVSGKQYLEFTGRADLRAPNGRVGTLLLDPTDITIEATGGTQTSQGSVFAGGGDTSRIDVRDLNAQLAISDVQVTTNSTSSAPLGGMITQLAGADINWNAATTLLLQSDAGVQLNGNVTGSNAGAVLYLFASTGNVAQAAGTSITVPKLLAEANGGQVVLNSANNMVDVLAGRATGGFEFTNGKAFTVGQVTTPTFGGRTGLDGGSSLVDLRTTTGTITVGAQIASGTLTLMAGTAPADAVSDIVVDNASVQSTVDQKLDASRDVRIGTLNALATSTSLQGNQSMTIEAGRDVMVGTVVPAGASPFTNVSSGGKVLVTATRDAMFGSSGGSGTSFVNVNGGGGGAKGVAISAGNDAFFSAATTVQAFQSPISVLASQDILGAGDFISRGNVTGSIMLTATNGGISYGTVNSSGSFSAIPGGAITLTASQDITGGDLIALSQCCSFSVGSPGGAVTVTSQNGGISIGRIDSSGNAAGGNVTVKAKIAVATGDINAAANDNSGSGGTVQVTSETSSIGTGAIRADGDAAGGGVSVKAKTAVVLGSIDTSSDSSSGDGGGAVEVTSETSSLQMGTVQTFGRGAGGSITLGAPGDITASDLRANATSFSSSGTGDGGRIEVISTTGNLTLAGVSAGAAAGGMGGEIVLQALLGSITNDSIDSAGGNSSFGGPGGRGGEVTVFAKGKIQVGSVRTPGGSALSSPSIGSVGGGAGGNVNITSTNGNVLGLGAFETQGGYGAPGGRGGDVTVMAENGAATLIRIIANGGQGGATIASGDGGMGGTVLVKAGAGGIRFETFSEADTAVESKGGSAENAGRGGDGGSITLISAGDIAVVPPPPPPESIPSFPVLLVASGGQGTSTSGNGGTIVVEAAGNIDVWRIAAAGGNGLVDFSGDSGSGGRGGKIVLQTGGDLTLVPFSSLDTRGGAGGNASPESGRSGGAGGDGGEVIVRAPGKVVTLFAPTIAAEGGPGGSGDNPGPSGASGQLGALSIEAKDVMVNGTFDLRAIWTNPSNTTVNLGDGDAVRGIGGLRNAGTLGLDGTTSVEPGMAVQNLAGGRLFVRSGVATVRLAGNEAAGVIEIAPGSTLTAQDFLSNEGIVKVDGVLDVGSCSECVVAASTFDGPTFVNAQTGELTGFGTIVVGGGLGTVDNFGTISPGGGSIGKLTLASNLVMEEGSRLAVDLASTSSNDLLKVERSALTAAGSKIDVNSASTFSPGDSFLVLQSASLDASNLPIVTPSTFQADPRGNELFLVVGGAAAPSPSPSPDVPQEVLNFWVMPPWLFQREDGRQRGEDDVFFDCRR